MHYYNTAPKKTIRCSSKQDSLFIQLNQELAFPFPGTRDEHATIVLRGLSLKYFIFALSLITLICQCSFFLPQSILLLNMNFGDLRPLDIFTKMRPNLKLPLDSFLAQ